MSKHHKAMDGWRWARVRASILERDGGVCQIRNPAVCRGVATQVHHIVPLSKGGSKYDPGNLAACCQPCNLAENRRKPRIDTSWTI